MPLAARSRSKVLKSQPAEKRVEPRDRTRSGPPGPARIPGVKLLRSFVLAVLACAPAFAQTGGGSSTDPAVAIAPPPRVLKYRFVPEKSKISFELPTTFHLVHGTIGSWSGSAEVDPRNPGVLRSRIGFRADSLRDRERAPQRRPARQGPGGFAVPGDRVRRKELQSKPVGVRPRLDRDGELSGDVVIHGVSKPLQASVQCAVLEDHILVAGAVPIHWKQYGLRNMSTVFNRIQDPLTVIFHLWAVAEN